MTTQLKVLIAFVTALVLLGVETLLYLTGQKTAFTFLLPFVAIGIVTLIYFFNNPVAHDLRFRLRCYANWLPLGLTYASLYWGRYNLTEAKKAFGDELMSKAHFGTIFAVGAIVYGLSFIINGPLTDRIGGRKAILIGATGAALANLLLGVFTYQVMTAAPGEAYGLLMPFIIVYAINMYFQSFGAVSIVKVNAAWFHIRERGVFGGIFGTLISLGIYLAFDLTRRVLFLTRGDGGETQIWWAFFIPAIVLAFWVVVDFLLLKDTPGEAGFQDFNTGDAGSADTDAKKPLNAIDLYRRILSNRVIWMMIIIEFCSGVLRNGIMHWGTIYAKDVGVNKTDLFFVNWGLVLMVAGISGGFFAGFLSDKFFNSRRGPSAFFLYAGMFIGFVTMIFAVRFGWHASIGFLSFFM
ncbi:MAG: MFS transporter, partial [Deltaproteobacteria bacterium]|nr:MFS transporter [Deltaproteobacteria bacterium]